MTHSEYHRPDERWSIFGCDNYEAYLEKYLVKGRFHSGVHEDVKKNFETVEYLLAHAWYHYPLYDEAFNKVLRTFEMAIVQKCNLLNIPTKEIQRGKEKDIRLFQLIKEICVKEPGKRQSIFLDHLRDLRNLHMHQKNHSYVGGMTYFKLKLAVNILNILFAEEQAILRMEERLKNRMQQVGDFTGKACYYTHGNSRSLLHNISLTDVFLNKSEEIWLLDLEPVLIYTEKQKAKSALNRPRPFELKNPECYQGKILGLDNNSGLNVIIEKATEPVHIMHAEEFREYLMKIDPKGPGNYINMMMNETSKNLQLFRYKYYQYLT